MAPVNPRYSERDQDLKSALTTIATSNYKSKFSVISFRNHIKVLWGAVFSESFVFSFKNMHEINILDRKHGEQSSKLQSSILKLQSNEVFSSDDEGLDDLQTKLVTCLDEVVQELQKHLLDGAEKFFKNCGEHADIMIHVKWKEKA